MKILVLGLGNELLSDDGAGIWAARRLRDVLVGQDGGEVTVVESAMSGVALLELFIGYDRAVIVDAIQTGARSPGSIVELSARDLAAVVAPSPHYAGLPELLALARQLHLKFPREIRILAVEAGDLQTIGGPVSSGVEKALPELVQRVLTLIASWKKVSARA